MRTKPVHYIPIEHFYWLWGGRGVGLFSRLVGDKPSRTWRVLFSAYEWTVTGP